jgi:fructose-1,6-bisphosphatase/inositol monophosphatase family enzyme
VTLIDRVSGLLAEVVAEEVMPRFRLLAAEEIVSKVTEGDPDDLVTAVDHAVERRLTGALAALMPDARVIGEEAACATPALLEALAADEPVWLVDPIDGTKSFARGDDAFGVMIALVTGGATRAAWIARPARGEIFVAEEGGGAFVNGRRLHPPAAAPVLRGTLYTRFMPPALAAAVEQHAAGRYLPLAGAGAASVEYPAVIEGEKDFVVYYRLLPWDHAAGSLLLAEAGGRVEHLDGRGYGPRSCSEITVLGGHPAVCGMVRMWLSAIPR